MPCNVGGIDRILRIVVGAAILSLMYFKPEFGLWPLVGLVPLLTGAVGFCPLYPIIGVSTCKK